MDVYYISSFIKRSVQVKIIDLSHGQNIIYTGNIDDIPMKIWDVLVVNIETDNKYLIINIATTGISET